MVKKKKSGEENRLAKKAARIVHGLRKVRKLRQVDLASAVNLSPRHLQKIESGEIDLHVSTIDALAKSLDVPACYLINDVCNHCLSGIGMDCPYDILSVLPIGIYITNLQGNIIYTNKKFDEILGISEPYKKGPVHIWDFLSDPAEVDKSKAYFESMNPMEQLRSQYSKIKSADGTVVPVKFDFKSMTNKQNDVTGILALVTSHPSW